MTHLLRTYDENKPENSRPDIINSHNGTQNQQGLRIAKKQYRNGTYVGGIENRMKHGLGMLIMDKGSILFGNWESDAVSGQCFYLGQNLRLFGKVGSNGLLEGFHVIKINKSQAFEEENQKFVHKMPMSLYGNFKNGKLFGKFITVIQQTIYICNATLLSSHSQNEQVQILKTIKNKNHQDLPQALSQLFPYIHTLEPDQYLCNMIRPEAHKAVLAKYHPSIQQHSSSKDEKITFYGYSTNKFNNKSKCIQFGFVLNYGDLLSAGDHANGLPNGLATVYQYKGCVHDGLFAHGKAYGFGVRYDTLSNRHCYGNFKDQNAQNNDLRVQNKQGVTQIIKQGTGWPSKLVRQYRSQMHLRSLCFDSNFAQITIKIPYAELQKVLASIYSTKKEQISIPIQQSRDNRLNLDNKLGTNRHEKIQPYSFRRLKEKSFEEKSSPGQSHFDLDKNSSKTNQKPRSKVKTTVQYEQYQTLYKNYLGGDHYKLKGKQDQINPFIFPETKSSKESEYRSSYKTEGGGAKSTRTRQERANTMSSMLGQFKK